MRILYVLILITLQKSSICKKRRFSTSDESIENLLFYKDCRHKGKDDNPPVNRLIGPLVTAPPPPPPPPPQCPCPRVCCSLCCDCGNFQPQSSFMSQQVQHLSPIQPLHNMDMGNMGMPQNMPQQPPRTRKKPKQILQPPIGGRRDLGAAREHIKGLIAQDEDIKKILKDLVRVTMQKVNVIETIKARKAAERQQVSTPKEQNVNDKVDAATETEEEDE